MHNDSTFSNLDWLHSMSGRGKRHWFYHTSRGICAIPQAPVQTACHRCRFGHMMRLSIGNSLLYMYNMGCANQNDFLRSVAPAVPEWHGANAHTSERILYQ